MRPLGGVSRWMCVFSWCLRTCWHVFTKRYTTPPPILWNLFHLQRLSEYVCFVYLQLPVAANDSSFCPSILFCSDNNLRGVSNAKVMKNGNNPSRVRLHENPSSLPVLSTVSGWWGSRATHVGQTQMSSTCDSSAGTENNPERRRWLHPPQCWKI